MDASEGTEFRRRSAGRSLGDVIAAAVVLVAFVLAYAPMLRHLAMVGARTTQALNAFILLAFAGFEAWRRERRQLILEVRSHGLFLFSFSCVLLAVASITEWWPLTILAMCLNLAALLSFGWGPDCARSFYPAIAGLGLAAVLLMLVPRLDLLLRLAGALFSARLLNALGWQAVVLFRPDPIGVFLSVARGTRVFDVASECNGYGVILSCAVLAALYAVRIPYPLFVKAALLVAALLVGLLFNALRIGVIVVLNMRTSWPYHWIHEGAGTAVYLLALLVVTLLVILPGRRFSGSVSRPG